MATVLITGGTGLIGRRLTTLLINKGHRVLILSRTHQERHGDKDSNPAFFQWHPEKGEIDYSALQQADYIINLAGAGIADKRWNTKRKAVISESRIKSGQLISQSLKETPNNVKAVIAASAMGWYGDDNRQEKSQAGFSEDMMPASDFLGTVCKVWEECFQPVITLGKRLVIIRTGIVLSAEGGALKEFLRPVRLGLAAILGSGKQMQSWIHIDDICRIYIHAIENEEVNGVYNASAPEPIDHRTLISAIAQKKKGSFFIPIYVPNFLLKWLLGDLGKELTKGVTLNVSKIRQTGFRFLFPSLEAALNDLL